MERLEKHRFICDGLKSSIFVEIVIFLTSVNKYYRLKGSFIGKIAVCIAGRTSQKSHFAQHKGQ